MALLKIIYGKTETYHTTIPQIETDKIEQILFYINIFYLVYFA